MGRIASYLDEGWIDQANKYVWPRLGYSSLTNIGQVAYATQRRLGENLQKICIPPRWETTFPMFVAAWLLR